MSAIEALKAKLAGGGGGIPGMGGGGQGAGAAAAIAKKKKQVAAAGKSHEESPPATLSRPVTGRRRKRSTPTVDRSALFHEDVADDNFGHSIVAATPERVEVVERVSDSEEMASDSPAAEGAMDETKTRLEQAIHKDRVKSALQARSDVRSLESDGIYKTAIQSTAQELERAMKKDTVRKGISKREDADALTSKGILKSTEQAKEDELELARRRQSVDKDIAHRRTPSALTRAGVLRGTGAVNYEAESEALELAIHKDKVGSALRDRRDVDTLESGGIYKTPLQSTAQELELAMAKDAVGQSISTREGVDALASKGILKTQTQAKREELALAIRKDKVKSGLQARADVGVLESGGIYKTPVQSAADDLERAMKKDSVRKDMEHRRTASTLTRAGVIHGGAVNYEAETDALGKAMTKDAIGRGISKRGSAETLASKGILKTPAQAKREELALAIHKDKVKSALEGRTDVGALESGGIYKTPLQSTAEELSRAMKKDSVRKDMEHRRTASTLTRAGVLRGTGAVNYEAESEALEKAMTKDAVRKGMSGRPQAAELVGKGIIRSQAQAKQTDLQKAMASDSLRRGMRRRSDASELQMKGIIKSQQRAKEEELQKAMVADYLRKGLRRRGTVEELSATGILKTPTRAKQDDLAKAIVADQLRAGLARRGSVDDFKAAGIVKSAARAKQEELAKAMIADKLRAGLGRRASVDELTAAGILKTPTRVKQEELEKAMISDSLRQGIKARDHVSELESRKIYKTTQQATADGLEKALSSAQLKQRLRRRSTVDELKATGIYRTPADAKRYELQKLMSADGISSHLRQRRASQVELESGFEVERTDAAAELRGVGDEYCGEVVRERRQRLERRLSRDVRMDAEALRQRGILSQAQYTDGAELAQIRERTKEERRKRRMSLTAHVKARPDPQYLIDEGIVRREYVHAADGAADASQQSEYIRKARMDLAKAVERKLAQRPSPEEIAAILESREEVAEHSAEELAPKRRSEELSAATDTTPPQDEAIISELKTIAGRHHRFASAVDELKKELPFSGETAAIVAETMLQHMVDSSEVRLCTDAQCRDPSHDHSLALTADGRRQRRQSITALDAHLGTRVRKGMLQDMAVLRREDASDKLMPAIDSLSAKLRRQPAREDMERRGLLRRSSVSAAIQPVAGDLERSLTKIYAKQRASLTEIDGGRRRRSSGAVSHDIAPSLEQRARLLHKKQLSHKLDLAMAARPEVDDMLDNGYLLMDPTVSHSLQSAAVSLESKLKYRVTEEYLKKKGFLPAKLGLEAAMHSLAGDLTLQLKRRPSLLDKDEFLERVLRDIDMDAIPSRDESFVGGELASVTGGVVGGTHSALAELGSDDISNLQAKRRAVACKLEKRLPLRPSLDRLAHSSLIPYSAEEYVSDPLRAHEAAHGVRRKMVREDIAWRLQSRMSRDDLVARGISRPEYFDSDLPEAQAKIRASKRSARHSLEKKLATLYQPVLEQMEDEGVVERGWFDHAAGEVAAGRRRAGSMVNELQAKLLERPDYASIVAEGLLDDDLEPGADTRSDGAVSDFQSESSESYDEEDDDQRLRLASLEASIARRPSQADVSAMGYIMAEDSRVAPALHAGVQQLEVKLKARKSLDEMREKGFLVDGVSAKREAERQKVGSTLKAKLGGRRPSQAELETRGVVPEGYFASAKEALASKLRRRQSVVHDLSTRLAVRPEYTQVAAKGLFRRALERQKNKEALISAEVLRVDRIAASAQSALASKLATRSDPQSLLDSGLLKQDPRGGRLDTSLLQSALSLEDRLATGRPTAAEMDACGLLPKQFADAPEHAAEMQRDARLRKVAALTRQLQRRPDQATVQDRGYAPHGVFEDVDYALQMKQARRESITAELSAMLPRRPTHEDLVKAGVIREEDAATETPHVTRKNTSERVADAELHSAAADYGSIIDETPASRHRKSLEMDGADDEVYEIGGPLEGLGVAGAVFEDFASVHKSPLESVLAVESLVPEPELTAKTIKTSPLAFLSVADAIDDLHSLKLSEATRFVNEMKAVSNELKQIKGVYNHLAEFGHKGLDDSEFALWFEQRKAAGGGSVEEDMESTWLRIEELQKVLYTMDADYRPVHCEVRKLAAVSVGLCKYQAKYQSNMSQLRRVLGRINEVLSEHKIQKETAVAALEATELQQATMKAKIVDKTAATLLKMDAIKEAIVEEKLRILSERSILTVFFSDYVLGSFAPFAAEAKSDERPLSQAPHVDSWDQSMEKTPALRELEEELEICAHFVTGLDEFLVGLKRLRKEQSNRIAHLEAVIEAMTVQRAEIQSRVDAEESAAMELLHKVRGTYVAPMQAKLVGGAAERCPVEPEYHYAATASPLSAAELARRRNRRMERVRAKLRDLEARALTTSSSDYLRGLTEIRQLQAIMAEPRLKYFFTHFVSKCNQVFHDIQLAAMALLERSADLESPVLRQLAGVQCLTAVIASHKLKSERIEHYLDAVQRVVSRLPDREVVIMQVARHLASADSYAYFVTGQQLADSEDGCRAFLAATDFSKLIAEVPTTERNQFAILDAFIDKLIREWMASMLDAFGATALSSFRVSLEDDVIAQVRPNKAALLAVSCVFGIDVAV